jgi:hypothetical protein
MVRIFLDTMHRGLAMCSLRCSLPVCPPTGRHVKVWVGQVTPASRNAPQASTDFCDLLGGTELQMGMASARPHVRTCHQRGDGSRSYGEIHCKNSVLLPATDRPSRHPGAPFGHGNASARRQRSGHSQLAPPRPRMPWRTKAHSMMAPQGGLVPGAAGGCRGWAETQSASSFSATDLRIRMRVGRCGSWLPLAAFWGVGGLQPRVARPKSTDSYCFQGVVGVHSAS